MAVSPIDNTFVPDLDDKEESYRPKRFKPGLFLLEVLGFLLLILFFSPFILVIINSAKSNNDIVNAPLDPPETFTQIFTNIGRILENDSVRYIGSFFNSFLITSLSLVAIGVLSAMAAWVLVRRKKRYSFFLFMFFLSGMVIPFQVVMIPLVQLLRQLREITGIPFMASSSRSPSTLKKQRSSMAVRNHKCSSKSSFPSSNRFL
jgi:ABC-type glycerol-3-phosphate transport system permease component